MTDPTSTIPNPWPAALERLRGQMTRAAFDTWLAGTTATPNHQGITVHVKTTYAMDWLSQRLHSIITQTVANAAGRQLTVRYQVGGGPAPEEPAPPAATRPNPGPGEFSVELVSFDPAHWGHVTTQRYALVFWQPWLGAFRFSVWGTLRAFAWHAEAEGWPSIQLLADICAKGNRHRLLGRAERAGREAQIGALEILTKAKIIHVRTQDQGRKTQYYFRVLDNLPLLTPRQIEYLSPALQERHREWLLKCSIDYEDWQQLSFETLLDQED